MKKLFYNETKIFAIIQLILNMFQLFIVAISIVTINCLIFFIFTFTAASINFIRLLISFILIESKLFKISIGNVFLQFFIIHLHIFLSHFVKCVISQAKASIKINQHFYENKKLHKNKNHEEIIKSQYWKHIIFISVIDPESNYFE